MRWCWFGQTGAIRSACYIPHRGRFACVTPLWGGATAWRMGGSVRVGMLKNRASRAPLPYDQAVDASQKIDRLSPVLRFISEELVFKGLMAPLGQVQDLGKFGLFAQRVQQGICDEIRIREKSAFNTAAQGTQRLSFVAQGRIHLCNFVRR